jgi:trigger factor
MAKILEYKYSDKLNLEITCLAEKDEYQKFASRITEQFLENVEIKGFRKGKAPKDLAMQKVNPLDIQNTIYLESVNRFFAELKTEVDEYLVKEDRKAIHFSAKFESVKETDEGLEFVSVVNLLPQYNIDAIVGKEIVVDAPDETKGRVSKSDFLATQKNMFLKSLNDFVVDDRGIVDDFCEVTVDLEENITHSEPKKEQNQVFVIGSGSLPLEFENNLLGVKVGEEKEFSYELKSEEGHLDHKHEAHYKIKVLAVKYPKFKTLDEFFKDNLESKKTTYKDESELEGFLLKIYDQETNQILKSSQKNAVIKTLVEELEDIDLPTEQVNNEVNRIYKVLDAQASTQKVDIAEIYNQSGLPGSEEKVKNAKEVSSKLEEYVKKEFKLAGLLQVVYHQKVEQKITDEDLDELEKIFKQNPENYDISKEIINNPERLRDVSADRLLRAKAYDWVSSQIKFTFKDSAVATEPKKASKSEEKPKKEISKAKKVSKE